MEFVPHFSSLAELGLKLFCRDETHKAGGLFWSVDSVESVERGHEEGKRDEHAKFIFSICETFNENDTSFLLVFSRNFIYFDEPVATVAKLNFESVPPFF